MSGRKRFIEDEAADSESEGDRPGPDGRYSDEDSDEADYIRPHQHVTDLADKSVEELVARYESRHTGSGRTRRRPAVKRRKTTTSSSAAAGGRADEDEEGEEEDEDEGRYAQVASAPSLIQPIPTGARLFKVGVKNRHERECVVRIYSRYVARMNAGDPLPIASVTARDGVEGWLYVEADSADCVAEAVNGLLDIYGTRIELVAPEDYPDVLYASRIVVKRAGGKDKEKEKDSWGQKDKRSSSGISQSKSVRVGEKARIIRGDLIELVGVVSSVAEGTVVLRPLDAGLGLPNEITCRIDDVKRFVAVGDAVQTAEGTTGLVVAVHENEETVDIVLPNKTIVSNVGMDKVSSSNAAGAGSAPRLSIKELSPVRVVATGEQGVFLQAKSGLYEILLPSGITSIVNASDIVPLPKTRPEKANRATDRNGALINPASLVRIDGTAAAVLQRVLWLYDGRLFVCEDSPMQGHRMVRVVDANKVSVEGVAAGDRHAAAMKAAQNNRLMNQRVRILRGAHRGLDGRVINVGGDDRILVEVDAAQKKILFNVADVKRLDELRQQEEQGNRGGYSNNNNNSSGHYNSNAGGGYDRGQGNSGYPSGGAGGYGQAAYGYGSAYPDSSYGSAYGGGAAGATAVYGYGGKTPYMPSRGIGDESQDIATGTGAYGYTQPPPRESSRDSRDRDSRDARDGRDRNAFTGAYGYQTDRTGYQTGGYAGYGQTPAYGHTPANYGGGQ